MTELFRDGFESGDFLAWLGFGVGTIVQSTFKHSGTYAMNCRWPGEQVYTTFDSNPTNVRFYIYITSAPSEDVNYAALWGTVSGDVFVRITATSLLQLIVPSGIISSGQTLSLNTWYCIEVQRGSGIANLWLNGNLVASSTTETIVGNTYELDLGVLGSSLGNVITYIDDVVISDAYIGPEGTPPNYILTYQSNPIVVPCTVNGQTVNPGESIQVPSGTSVTISVPTEVNV
ncbi:LamG domain-containing protein [Candidatus Bathyarchaeota archaeon]|nr:LamG domain-containing protein [Candidatus Bathyarchaeota archaeon]